MDTHVLAVQEVGDPVALRELADRVGGIWYIETAEPEAGTEHAIRVRFLSRVPLTHRAQVSAFPDKLRAIQQGDGPNPNDSATIYAADGTGQPQRNPHSYTWPAQGEASPVPAQGEAL
jgi:hypothetical protein